MLRLALGLMALLALAGCGADNIYASDAEVDRVRYSSDKPPSITLLTVINTRSGEGAHSAMIVNGSEQVIWDPAGTWHLPQSPERHDVHYGAHPGVTRHYIDYHTRVSFYTVAQKIEVPLAVANQAIREMEAYGAVPKANCSRSVGTILKRLPGFETIKVAWFPKATMEQFGKLPGVTTQEFRDNDPDDNRYMLQ